MLIAEECLLLALDNETGKPLVGSDGWGPRSAARWSPSWR